MSAWKSERRTPRFYPDAVTLSAAATVEGVLAHMDTSPGCSVKDSFAALDLAPAGFSILFEAHWIQHSPSTTHTPMDGLQWRIVRTADELKVWAAAHGGGEVFRSELLNRPEVAILTACSGETLVGGAIAHRSEDVVGLSNVFAIDHDLSGVWESVSEAVSDQYAGLPIVGYESGADLDIALNVGFVRSGLLRVWIRD